MSNDKQSLSGRVVLITGAGKGLGRAWALHLAAKGASLVINNRGVRDQPSGNSADSVVAEIQAAGGQAVANYDSVERPGAAENLVATALGHFGRLDSVITNAGIDCASSFHKQPLEDFERVVEINFLAAARLLHSAWPVMREANYGRVVVVSSTAGLYGNHGQSAYAASKAALNGLMHTLSIEAAGRDIAVNSVAPYAYTKMTRSAFPLQQVEDFAPVATAPLVAWMASPQCSINGKTFIVGAGQVRLAQTLETASVPLGADTGRAVEELLGAPFTEPSPASASAEFADFMSALSGKTTDSQ